MRWSWLRFLVCSALAASAWGVIELTYGFRRNARTFTMGFLGYDHVDTVEMVMRAVTFFAFTAAVLFGSWKETKSRD